MIHLIDSPDQIKKEAIEVGKYNDIDDMLFKHVQPSKVIRSYLISLVILDHASKRAYVR